MRQVLVAEPLAPAGIELLRRSCQVTEHPKIPAAELRQIIGEYDALLVRSATQVTAEVLTAGTRLMVVGRAGTGVDNIDVAAATRRGIVVVNAPTANTVAVAEHTLALMLCLARHICQANTSMHAGRWQKSLFMGTELRHKTLGLVGLGRIGAAVAARAQAMEMPILAYDPFVSAAKAAQLDVELVALDELLARADYVSLHTPSTERTRGMIGSWELALLKPTAYLINCARGDLIAEQALIEALTQGRLAGAALDVYADEPQVNPALCACGNLLLTPHLGASTEEAQDDAAVEVAREVLAVIEGRLPRYPVNILPLAAEEVAFLWPYRDLAERMGRFHAQFAANHLTQIELTYAGEVTEHDTAPLTAAFLAGLLSEVSEEPINAVNAPLVARERGLVVDEVRTSAEQDFPSLLTLRTRSGSGQRVLSGTVIRNQPHIVRIDDYWLDFVAQGVLLVSEHCERPGILGQMGALLGEVGINISFVQVGRQSRGGMGVMVLGVDDPLTPEALERLMTLPSIRSAYLVRL